MYILYVLTHICTYHHSQTTKTIKFYKGSINMYGVGYMYVTYNTYIRKLEK